ncbi:hypothetical protein CRUP_003393, partial [Coryphaenoides rupestris]
YSIVGGAPFKSRGNALRQASAWRGSRGPVLLLLLGGVVVAAVVSVTVAWLVLATGADDREITETLVSRRDLVSREPRVYEVPCSEDYDNYQRYPGCTPVKCGRAVTDAVVTREEAQTLRRGVRGADSRVSTAGSVLPGPDCGRQFV